MITWPPLTPHLLIKVRLKIFSLYPSAHFLTQFEVVPARLDFLRMEPRYWIDEVTCINHNSVVGNVVNPDRHASISRPVIRVYNCPRSDASGDDGIKSGNVAPIDNLEVTSCRGEFRYDYSKNPRVSGSSSSPVILKMLHMIIITQLNSLVTKVNLYPYCIVSWICCFCWICCLSAFAEFVALRA